MFRYVNLKKSFLIIYYIVGVCPEATLCGRVPYEGRAAVRVRPVHSQPRQVC